MNKEEKLKKEQKAKEINKLKGLRITLIVFIIILLSLISFVGIYVKDKNEMSDVIPDFILGSDIEGNRIIQLNVEQDETITLTDSTGAKIASGTEEELSKDVNYCKLRSIFNQDLTYYLVKQENEKEVIKILKKKVVEEDDRYVEIK